MMTPIAYTDLIGSIKSAILEHDLKKRRYVNRKILRDPVYNGLTR